MTCQEIVKILPEYAVDNVSDSVREIIVVHLAECPDCTKEFKLVQRTGFLLNTIKLEEAPVGLWGKVEAQIKDNQISRPETKIGWNIFNWHQLKPIPAFVTTAIIFLILGGFWFHNRLLPTQQPLQVRAIEEPIETYLALHNAAELEDPVTDKNGAGVLLVTAEEMTGEK
jgi:hypothetical protein